MKVGADPPHDLHNVIDAIVSINPKPNIFAELQKQAIWC
jgi:hypothetical protein